MKTLPEHVRKLVAEIETEIGEGEHAVEEIEGSTANRVVAPDRVRRIEGTQSLGDPAGRVEEAVRETLLVSAAGGLLAVLWLLRSPIIRTRDLTGLHPPELQAVRDGAGPSHTI